jgi:hypothetical protein
MRGICTVRNVQEFDFSPIVRGAECTMRQHGCLRVKESIIAPLHGRNVATLVQFL